ncbi:MAG: hypothetical protein NWF05_09665 [Candidatus Bathyarchaeota archaeon]|nr:hypothetical protein [Candidatus Bathyarchaeota archaeon]
MARGRAQTKKTSKKKADDNEVIKVRIRKSKPELPAAAEAALFSPKDVRRFVTEFVASWIRGDITIHFPTAAELSKKNPLSITFPTDPSVNQELKIKEHYVDLLSICAGTKPASAEEQEKAIDDVFRILLMFRSANRIEGKIISGDLEKRVAELEKTAKSTGKLVEQITAFLFKENKPNP